MSIFKPNLESYPYHGRRKVTGQVILVHFKDLMVELQDRLTQDAVYEVVRAEGYGDLENFVIIDDDGKEMELASYFIEELE